MTDLTPIKARSKGRTQATGVKTVLIDALVASNRNYLKAYGSKQHRETRSLIANYRGTFYGQGEIEVDQAAQAITDHFLNREKVRAALIEALKASALHECTTVCSTPYEIVENGSRFDISSGDNACQEWACAFDSDVLLDRLIASLAGGSQ